MPPNGNSESEERERWREIAAKKQAERRKKSRSGPLEYDGPKKTESVGDASEEVGSQQDELPYFKYEGPESSFFPQSEAIQKAIGDRNFGSLRVFVDNGHLSFDDVEALGRDFADGVRLAEPSKSLVNSLSEEFSRDFEDVVDVSDLSERDLLEAAKFAHGSHSSPNPPVKHAFYLSGFASVGLLQPGEYADLGAAGLKSLYEEIRSDVTTELKERYIDEKDLLKIVGDAWRCTFP